MRDFIIECFMLLLRVTLGVWLKLAYNIKGYNVKIKGLKAPYLLIGNHCMNWDAFTAGKYIPYGTRFIASDSLFRDKFVAFLLTYLVGAIPKKKAVSDLMTIKLTMKEFRKGHVVGVYPEANRTWNGRSIDILYSTAKFVKLMKVPVVNCVIKGGYLSRPRWSVRGRRGVLELHYDILFTKEDLKAMTVDEIYEKMNSAIQYNEFDWQKDRMIRYRSRKPAEFLENYLYICPRCKAINRLESNRDEFLCLECGLSHTMNEYGYFNNEGRMFENPQEWGDWQAEHFRGLVGSGDRIYSDAHTVMYGENEHGNLYIAAEGELSLYDDRLVFKSPEMNRTFMINDIFGNTIQLNYIFDFYYKGDFVRMKFLPKNRTSAFKWNYAVDFIQSLSK